ncbi:MAG: glycosyltransferase family 4 protein [Stellaceae bacterium]
MAPQERGPELAAAAPVGRGGRNRHLLHVFPSFGIGGLPLRMVRIINHFGTRLRHTIVALDDDFAAAGDLADDLDLRLLRLDRRRGMVGTVRQGISELRRLRPDLLVTYNWGAIEWAMANRLCPVARQLHFEAGFGKEEADTQLRRRVLFRRWALARAGIVVVPSRQLADIARRVWRLPAGRVAYVPNGVDVARFADLPRDRAAAFIGQSGELVVGTVAPLRAEKNIGRLLRAFALLESGPGAVPSPRGAPAIRLVIAGEGAERPVLERLAGELGLADRVVFTGQVRAEAVLGAFDVFALSSDTEQMPNALLEAMAAGRAVAAVDVGDVRDMVCEANRAFVVPRDDTRLLADAIARLLRDPQRRAQLGHDNHRRAIEEFSQQRMFSAYSFIFDVDHAV